MIRTIRNKKRKYAIKKTIHVLLFCCIKTLSCLVFHFFILPVPQYLNVVAIIFECFGLITFHPKEIGGLFNVITILEHSEFVYNYHSEIYLVNIFQSYQLILILIACQIEQLAFISINRRHYQISIVLNISFMWIIRLSIKQSTLKGLRFTACNQQKSWDPSQKTVS